MFSSPLALALNSSLLRRSNGKTMNDSDEISLAIGDPNPMKVGSSPIPPSSTPPLPSARWRRLWSRVQGPLLLLWIVFCCKVAVDSVMTMDVELRNYLLYETFLYYNPLFLVAMMIWLWGINVWVFMISGINYAKVFELDTTHLTFKDIWTNGRLVYRALHAKVIECNSSLDCVLDDGDCAYKHDILFIPIFSWRKLICCITASIPSTSTPFIYLGVLLYSVLPLIMVLPVDVFYVSSRIFFLRTLVRLLLPLQPISFADFFVADVLTSMAKVLSDLERATCRMFHGQVATLSWFDADSTCGSHSVWIPCVLALPYLCRFFQCLRQYSDSKDKSCIFNALKYATAFPVILLSALKYHVVAESWEGLYRPLWLFSGLINTCFSFYWDIRRDWELSFFLGIYNPKHPFLRANLLYNSHWVYYGAIGSNLLLRCAWTYKLSAHLRHNYITVFLMTALEMLRRFQWIFFRVENEWIRMTTRVNSQIAFEDASKEAKKLLSSF